ncbi:MAG: serine/threonine protein kinase [Okeania sp. SIO3I5]|uniref:AAA-like domain-containing protein n=1 Tax=Okeania sp. SIO3I5 TaxID=2607805 RepID=UPI0013BB90F3|nr:AAA-like domain-containing protein [Okeania sp. SIO3I5]NEQ40447.1 serine/threonine protein kinase [Okeania sp. SIO3I5]
MSITFPAGVIPLNSPFYIEKTTIEKEILTEIQKPGALVRIRAPREMGKSSVLLRMIHEAHSLDYRTVSLDLKQASQSSFNNIDKFLHWFCVNVALGLGLEPRLEGYWDENIGCKVSSTLYFENYLLRSIDSPLVLALDDLNLIFDYSEVVKDFFTLLCSWHEKSRVLPMWQNLRLLLVYSTEIDVPLEIYQSLFHLGFVAHLDSFTLEEVMELVKLYELNFISEKDTKLLMDMTGGHPALVHLAIYYLSQEKLTLMELLDNAPTSTGIYGSHLYRYQMKLQLEPELATALKTVINSTEPVLLNPILANKLNNMGLIKLNQNKAVISCQLYQDYFQQTL